MRISRAASGRIARGGELERSIQICAVSIAEIIDILVVWEWVPTYPPMEDLRVIGILLDRAEVEDPVLVLVSRSDRLYDALEEVLNREYL